MMNNIYDESLSKQDGLPPNEVAYQKQVRQTFIEKAAIHIMAAYHCTSPGRDEKSTAKAAWSAAKELWEARSHAKI